SNLPIVSSLPKLSFQGARLQIYRVHHVLRLRFPLSTTSQLSAEPDAKMSSTLTTSSIRYRKFHWPEIQLNIWLLIVLAASATCLGIFSWFMVVQSQMQLGTPW